MKGNRSLVLVTVCFSFARQSRFQNVLDMCLQDEMMYEGLPADFGEVGTIGVHAAGRDIATASDDASDQVHSAVTVCYMHLDFLIVPSSTQLGRVSCPG